MLNVVQRYSLTEQLEGLRDSFDESKSSVLETFLNSKKVGDLINVCDLRE